MGKFLIIFLLSFYSLSASPTSNLMDDLLIVDEINRQLNDRMPVTYNHLLYGGYINMPSARMSCEGVLGAGFSYVPPYHNYNLYCQLTPFLEISGNYRVFRGVDDPILTPLGFGDKSDKGANVKFSIFSPEDSDYKLPGFAVGMEDFLGTRNFMAKYLVFTKVFIEEDLEISLGYGWQRIRGFFGGLTWMPFRKSCTFLAPLSFVAEYDATPYKSKKYEPHPKGRSQKCKINAGLKYRLFDTFDLSVSYVRGEKFAASVAAFYDFGHTEGFLPKIDDSLPYRAPIVIEPLGPLRSESSLVTDLIFAFSDQGIELLKIELGYDDCRQKTLRLRIYNNTYRLEPLLRERLNCLLAGLIPRDIDQVVVVVDAEGFPIQEYHYQMGYVRMFGEDQIGDFELSTLTPLTEVSYGDPFCFTTLFEKNKESAHWLILPKTHTFFGSAKGKFKYSLGINVGLDGFLPSDIYYSILLGYNIVSNLYDLSDSDILNPSQIINVRSDIVRYYKQKAITLDEAYLQKCWNMGEGFYSRLALGYFEEEYAGLAAQVLYYPLHKPFAVGLEGAIFRKRAYTGWGFTGKVRKRQEWINFPFGSQCFLDLYYDWREAGLDLKLKIGKFLANDWGVRSEVSRTFESGLRVTFWYTLTNGQDKINGSTYYDKGISFSLPLDIFYTESSRKRWTYGMSAWLRDVGVTAATGQDLYNLINEQRQ